MILTEGEKKRCCAMPQHYRDDLFIKCAWCGKVIRRI